MPAQLPALSFRGTPIGDRGEMLSLTDMWKAAGAPEQKTPAKWRELPGTIAFAEHVADNIGKSDVFEATRGRNGATLAHWHVALAYAKHLDHNFHMWCNETVRARMEGRLIPAAAPALPDFTNPAAAARAWAEQYDGRVAAERAKAEIGSRREATAMATASREAQRANRLEIELDRSGRYATVKRMEALHRGREFDWRLLKRISQQKGWLPISVPDANYGTVKAYHAEVWLEAYGLDVPAPAVAGRAGGVTQ